MLFEISIPACLAGFGCPDSRMTSITSPSFHLAGTQSDRCVSSKRTAKGTCLVLVCAWPSKQNNAHFPFLLAIAVGGGLAIELPLHLGSREPPLESSLILPEVVFLQQPTVGLGQKILHRPWEDDTCRHRPVLHYSYKGRKQESVNAKQY